MKKLAAITFTSMMLLLATAMVVGAQMDEEEIRGQVATGDFTWNAQNFAGFYYDIDDNLGTETLTTTITEGNKLNEPNGIIYSTTAQKTDFEFAPWGYYAVIGFQAQQYFAAYLNDPDFPDLAEILYYESDDENSLQDEQLELILVDNDDEMTVTSGTPLKLEEGYELAIKSIDIDGNKVYLELNKDGVMVDSKVIEPSTENALMADKTYYYKKDVADSDDLVIIAVHFKNAFRGADQNLATIDGTWQISEVATEVDVDTEYDKMRIATVTSDTITMDNKDNTVTLSRNKDTMLMGDMAIVTSDQDVVSEEDPLRYYISKKISEPGTYHIRGSVATGDYTWNAQNFAGFYYDIDDNLGTETLTTTITEGNKLNEPDGIIYSTTAQKTDFDYAPWGYYAVIGFQAKEYFAAYLNDPDFPDLAEILYYESDDENSLQDEQLEAILIDNDDEMTVTSGTPLKLEEGYELAIKSIDIDGNKVYLELNKDGVMVDSKVIEPSTDNALMADKTYYYKKDVADSDDLVIIAVHFKNAFRGADQNLATIDGTWQISEVATEVDVDTEYDKMRIATVTSDTITMDNKDNSITLSRNKDIALMGDMAILTSDQDIVSEEDPQRYYIYETLTIEGAEPEAEPAPEVEAAPVEEPEAAEEPVAEPAPVEEPAAEEPAAEEPAAEEPAPAEEQPGFESIFAITGLLAVAYLVLGRRE